MAFGKWSMYVSAVLFVIIGLGSLAVAVIPGVDEWVTEQTLDSVSPQTSEFNDDAANIVAEDDVGAVRLTSLILAATFLPMAGLFVFCGRWFKSMQPSLDGLMATSRAMAANTSAFYQQAGAGVVVPGSGVITGTAPMPTGQAPVPRFGDPISQPPLG
jgi:hypothetical protein